MKLRCTYNKDNDDVFIVGNIYEGEFDETGSFGKDWYTVTNNHGNTSKVASNGRFWKFEIVNESEEKDMNEENKVLSGLEAIELMKEGKMVLEIGGILIYKIEEGYVYYKNYFDDEAKWYIDSNFSFSAKYEEYNEPKNLTGWERVDESKEEKFTIINSRDFGDLWELNDATCNDMYDRANYFSTKEKAKEIDFKQTLFRKLQRFSDENEGDKIDWSNHNQDKYYIHYDHDDKEIRISANVFLQEFGKVYFNSGKVTQQAIDLFHDDLIKYFTEM